MSATRRTSGQQSLRLALWLLLAVTCAATAAEVVLVRVAYRDLPVLAAYPLVGLSAVAVGLVAWDRRPSNRTGALLCLTGLTILGAAAGNVADPDVVLAGEVLAQAPIAALLHLLLAFPSGRLRTARARVLVVSGYLLTVGLQVPRVLPALQHRAGEAQGAQRVTGSLVLALSAALLWSRLRSARGDQRRPLALVSAYGIGMLLLFPVTAQLVGPALDWSPIRLFVVQVSALALVPYVFTAGVLTGAFARTGEVEELGAWLGSTDVAHPPLRDALAGTLGDASLELLFPRRDSGGLVDAAGRPVTPRQGPGRGAVEVAGADGPVARIVYDSRLIADPALVVAAGRIVALVLERERLTAELLAVARELRASRARVVEVADQERRRAAQDLHDLLQSRLLLAALHAGRLAAHESSTEGTRRVALQLRDELDEAIHEFRRLVHGLMPALLVERGLVAATEALADRMPLPVHLDLDPRLNQLPPALSSTSYSILAEALANAVKHAGATSLLVRAASKDGWLYLEVRDDGTGGVVLPTGDRAGPGGVGLRGIADRVEAVDGRLAVDSPLGGGTRVLVELPCAS